VTLARWREIRRGQGPPPTDEELAEIAAFSASLAANPAYRRAVRSAREAVAALPRAERVIAAAPKAERRRLERLPVALVARMPGARPRDRGVRPTPRRRSRSTRARSPGRRPDDDEEPSHDLVAIPIAAFRREVECPLGGGA
jgi:hypothetical protein